MKTLLSLALKHSPSLQPLFRLYEVSIKGVREEVGGGCAGEGEGVRTLAWRLS
jgi:hypothetical protein